MEIKVAAKSVHKVYEVGDITDGDVTWATDRSGSPGKMTFTLLKNTGELNYLEGDHTTVQRDGWNIFSGYVFKKVKNIDKIDTTCYDQLRYLKAKQSYNVIGMTAGGVIRMIAADFGLKVGYLEPTKYVLPTYLYDEKTLLDIIVDCISRTSLSTGVVYNFYDEYGHLTLRRAEDMASLYVIGNESLATDYTYETSIEDTYNYIKLVRPNKATQGSDAYIATDSRAMYEWGKLQYYEKVDEDLNDAQLREMTQNYLAYYAQKGRTLKLTCIGVPGIRAGSMILIDIPDLGDIRLKKMLLVNKCTHHISSGEHTMDLEMKVYNG